MGSGGCVRRFRAIIGEYRKGTPMFNLFDRLTTVYVSRPSTACRGVELSFTHGVAIVDFVNGKSYHYKASRRDMLELWLDPEASLGKWVNRKLDLNNPLPM